MQFIQQISAEVLKPQNLFTIEQVRDGKVIHSEVIANAVVTAGLNAILNTMFNSEAQRANWYIGLIDDAGFTAIDAADTMASHAGWAEFTTYSETTRAAWDATSSTAGSVTGTNPQTFTIGTVAAGSKIKGVFVTDTGTKGGTSGLLWATALYATSQDIATGDTFRLTYTLNAGN